MVEIDTRPINYRPRKDLSAEWDNFRKGLNLLLRPTELGRDEYSTGDNTLLTGSGVPTGRWGTSPYFTVNATGSIRGFGTYNNLTSLTNELIALSDQGYLAKKNGTSFTVITGQSYPSGSVVRAEQLGGFTYFVSKDVPMTKYNGSNLDVFSTLSAPTGLYVTNISGVSGPAQYSWRVLTLGVNGGHTTPSTNIVLNNLPQELSLTQINLSWSAPSAAASMINGYEIYRGKPGDETYLAAVNASVTRYTDFGDPASESMLAPTTNTTGGIESEYITVVNDRILMVDKNDPTKLLISGRYPYQSSFNVGDGGGFAYIGPDDGQKITGIEAQPGSAKGEIIVFKDFASFAVQLNQVAIGNSFILDPIYNPVSTSVGASNPDTIQRVENDIFYFGRKGLYVVGYEPNFLNIIRTNEISARIRPYLALLNDNDYKTACSMYVDNKYILSFPLRKEMVVYDRERGCFAGIWKLPWGISKMKKYEDGTGTERWVLGSAENNQVYTFESSVNSDNGATITKTLRLNKESFNSWSLLKILKLFYILFRNITGSVTVNIIGEDRNGTTSTIKTFTINGAAIAGQTGWGTSLWGTKLWGDTEGSIVTTTDELKKWGMLYKQISLVQIEVSCTAAASNFELLKIKMTASPGQEGNLPSSMRV
jgi:hypothetical protein